MRNLNLFIISSILMLFLLSSCSTSKRTTLSEKEPVKEVVEEPVVEEKPATIPTPMQEEPVKVATIETVMPSNPNAKRVLLETSMGNMTIELFDQTPQHRDNFLKLANEEFFHDLIFHRVINEFMIQGGDPNSKNAQPNVPLGTGGPGYTIPAEFNDQLLHYKGVLSAARQGDAVNPKKASSGSQFYIVQGRPTSEGSLMQVEQYSGVKYSADQKEVYKTLGGTPHLDHNYTVFGRVIEGLDVIDKIASTPTNRALGDRPMEDIKMKITVIKN